MHIPIHSISASIVKSRCILFDVDGTLINSWNLYIEVYWRTLRHFQGHNITKDAVLKMKPTSELQFIKKHIGNDRLKEAHDVMMDFYERMHDSMFGGIYPGISDMLNKVRSSNKVTGIVTGKSTRAWEITSSKIYLGDFDVVVADDDVEQPKPDPEGILTALQTVGASEDESIYIGDTVSDFKAARDANVRGILTLWAKSSAGKKTFVSRARENGATEFVDRPEELIEHIV